VDSAALKVEAGHTALEPGAGILLFTDGLTEGRAAQRGATRRVHLFGEERSRRIVPEHRGAPPERVLDALVSAVTTFAGGPLADDLCLVAVRVESASPT
jgi:serine phosphatase RsbU (regulator of sigma subunit)